MTFNEAKLRELVIYVAKKSQGDKAFGRVKLNKILFFSDAFAFAELGQPITGARYQKLDFGPAPRAIRPVIEGMIRDDVAHEDSVRRFGRTTTRLVPHREPDLKLFNAEEISVVDMVLEEMQGLNASEISDFSHDYSIGWQLASWGEDIPYATIFVSPDRPSEAARRRVKELALQNNWATAS